MTIPQKWLIVSTTCVFIGLIFLLQGILFPFAVGTALAYLGNPLVKKLKNYRMGRGLAVTLIFCIVALVIFFAFFVITPLLIHQIKLFATQIPIWGKWLQKNMEPLLHQYIGVQLHFLDLDNWLFQLSTYLKPSGHFLNSITHSLKASGFVFLHLLIDVILTPIIAFYLLKDWDRIVASFEDLFPRNLYQKVIHILKECDCVLSGFVRGQLLVMLILAIMYGLGLSIVGLQFALLIGLFAGLVSIIPYLGFIFGLLLALITAAFQFHEWFPFLGILIVFGVGHILEGFMLSPLLIGERIGLHPVAVIFAVMAGGQLFGFIGIVIALPVAAVLKVCLVHLHKGYKNSPLYAIHHAHSKHATTKVKPPESK